MRLSVDDIDLYGFCPERDTFYGVVCEICNSIVKPQALIQHMESRHPSGSSSLPPPSNSATKPAMKTPYCKLSKLKKSQSSGQLPVATANNSNTGSAGGGGNSNSNSKNSNNHTPVKQRATEQQPSLHSGISGTSPRSPLESSSGLGCVQSAGGFANALSASGSPVKSPGSQPKRKRLKTERSLLKDREYDPDRHCGVWNEETGKPCTRSLTCKAHTVSLRRTVAGRSKTFDKLLAEHRAAKELPNTRTPTKVTGAAAATTVTGTISVATADLGAIGALDSSGTTATGPAPTPELETPSSPPVLSLPDTYPLPQAVDLLYRCLAPHGSNKPTKLEEDFANELESNGRIESSVVNSSIVNSAIGSAGNSTGATSNSNSAMAPISVVLPSLSPIATGGMSPQASLLQYSRNVSSSSPIGVEQMISKQSPASASVAPTLLPVGHQSAPTTTTALEAKTAPHDIDASQNITMYTSSPVYKDKSQVTVQISRANMMTAQSSVSSSYPNLFESTLDHHHHHTTEAARTVSHAMTNGKRIGNHHAGLQSQLGRPKHDFPQEYATAIQLEATAASTPYTSFNDISWSSCHPEPLAVSRWLRITSSRKQYNFNIH